VRFGLQLPNYGPIAGPAAIAAIARRAEELGFHSLWASDHVLVPSSLPRYANVVEAVTTLVWAAAHTSRVRLGPSVLVLPQREPVLAAKQLAMVDVLSGGRLIAGLGVGYVEEEFGYLGAPFAGRGATLEGHVAVMRALWSGATEFDGPSASFSDARFGPAPPQGERIPIWLGGHATVALRRTAALADAWHPGYMDADTLAEKAAQLRSFADGRAVEIGLKLRISFGPSAFAHGQKVNACGTPSDVVDQLRRYEEAGADELVVVLAPEGMAAYGRELETFAADVMPRWR
jgi:probable F420-dependent oxidoreductase